MHELDQGACRFRAPRTRLLVDLGSDEIRDRAKHARVEDDPLGSQTKFVEPPHLGDEGKGPRHFDRHLGHRERFDLKLVRSDSFSANFDLLMAPVLIVRSSRILGDDDGLPVLGVSFGNPTAFSGGGPEVTVYPKTVAQSSGAIPREEQQDRHTHETDGQHDGPPLAPLCLGLGVAGDQSLLAEDLGLEEVTQKERALALPHSPLGQALDRDAQHLGKFGVERRTLGD